MRIEWIALSVGVALALVSIGPAAGWAGPGVDASAGGLVAVPEGIGRDQPDRFRDVSPGGGLLVGALVGHVDFLGGKMIGRLQPIYQVEDRLEYGPGFGADVPLTELVLAGPGEAVGAVKTRTGMLLNGFEFLFMEVRGAGEDRTLDVATARSSGWVGDGTGGGPAWVSARGRPVVGLVGLADDRWVSALGILADGEPGEGKTGFEDPVALPEGLVELPDRLRGYDVSRDLAPEGGVLVGFRVGYLDPEARRGIARLRPIYRAGGELVDGRAFGPEEVPLTDRVLAGPGDAVAAIRTRAGMWFDGVQVVFAEDEGDHLDLGDFYDSDWLGSAEGGGPELVSGQGGRVVGVLVRADGGRLGGLGLIVSPPKARRPRPTIPGVASE